MPPKINIETHAAALRWAHETILALQVLRAIAAEYYAPFDDVDREWARSEIAYLKRRLPELLDIYDKLAEELAGIIHQRPHRSH